MPHYHYICKKCYRKLEKGLGREPQDSEVLDSAVYETAHPMSPTEEELVKALVCPRCDSTEAEKTMIGTDVIGKIAGYGYKDKAGLKRDMNHFHLTRDDPYKSMRAPGEADDLALRLRRGSYKPSSARQYYDANLGKWIDTATGLPVESENKMEHDQ